VLPLLPLLRFPAPCPLPVSPEQVELPVPVPVPLPVELLPPPTGAAPPDADVTGMVVVVDAVGVVVVVVVGAAGAVVVVVVGAVAPVPPAVGVAEPVPATVSTAVGAEPPLCGDGFAATMALAGGSDAWPAETCDVPVSWLPVPTSPELADPAAAFPPGPASVVVVVVVAPGTTTPLERAESTDCATGPAPKLTPATIDNAAAATAPDAMTRLRPKYSLEAVIAAGRAGPGDSFGRGCPNERDVNTSSKVA
jgi:hypothetical protein